METENSSLGQSQDSVQVKKIPRLHINKRRVSQKLVYIVIEILIIVVAVNLSVWLNNKNNQRNEDKQAIVFLSGLKNDLREELIEIEESLQFYRKANKAYAYLSDLDRKGKVDSDTFRTAFEIVGISSWLLPNKSRYEGFKQSGKLPFIRDDSLQNQILYYFEDVIPSLGLSEESWISNHRKLQAYLVENLVSYPDGSNNSIELIKQAKAKNLCRSLIPWDQLFKRYELTKQTAKNIQIRIEKIEKTGFED